MASNVRHINPDGLFKSPAFSQVAVTEGPGKTIYIGGQNAVNEKAELVGAGDFRAQTEQVMKNITIALNAAGATFDHVIKLNIHVVQGNDLQAGFEAAQPFMSKTAPPPVVTVLVVTTLGNPDYLVEIDAIAYV